MDSSTALRAACSVGALWILDLCCRRILRLTDCVVQQLQEKTAVQSASIILWHNKGETDFFLDSLQLLLFQLKCYQSFCWCLSSHSGPPDRDPQQLLMFLSILIHGDLIPLILLSLVWYNYPGFYQITLCLHMELKLLRLMLHLFYCIFWSVLFFCCVLMWFPLRTAWVSGFICLLCGSEECHIEKKILVSEAFFSICRCYQKRLKLTQSVGPAVGQQTL